MEVIEAKFLECDRRYKTVHVQHNDQGRRKVVPTKEFDKIESMHAEYTRKIDALEAKLADQEKTIEVYRESMLIMHDAINTLQHKILNEKSKKLYK